MEFAIIDAYGKQIANLYVENDAVYAQPIDRNTDVELIANFVADLNERYHTLAWEGVDFNSFLVAQEDASLTGDDQWHVRTVGIWQRYYTEADLAKDECWVVEDHDQLSYLDKLLERYFDARRDNRNGK